MNAAIDDAQILETVQPQLERGRLALLHGATECVEPYRALR